MPRSSPRLRRALTAVGLATVVGFVPTAAATSSAEAPSLRSRIDAVHEAGMPGIQAAVRHGDESWTGAAGVADIRTERPLRAGYHHRVGSITKSFTATAVLQQVGRGRIELDAPIGKYLPALVGGERGQRITVRMLLNHTSGIADHVNGTFESWSQGSLASLEANRFRNWRPERLVEIGLSLPPTGAPGEKWSYSNTNYVIAGQLLEKITGKPARFVISRDVIRPLGLRDTYFPGPTPFVLGPHSKAYEALYHLPERRGEYSVFNMSWASTAGALISTPQDLNTFYRALLGGELLEPEQLAEMKRTVPVMQNGTRIGGYGLGLRRFDLGRCGTFWGHDGAVFGMGTLSLHDEDGSEQLSYGMNLTKYQHLGPNGRPQPHPIDRARGAFLGRALCSGAQSPATTLAPTTPSAPSPALAR
ncbi:D-alanyl-D-alanine carboxypeptidase [Saccharopolyspora lacisalsi]|uniref:D-alanyl-D-alanine carboxypeptidase n=1 Tax=Halosaccharopolyspora lacisalsi TaxID=1000566 RepID=A0A839DNJ4_9PSEU|nr:serine hydrolase domain-containing protein [Halosaccharopolyspora lacisalsi]MBA8823542.1 D-alanyl-D-alanine carboxypeptidase [Halosaccharopolyspora lacisalsi]